MWQSVNCTVSRLIRVRYGPFRLDRKHHAGEAIELSASECRQLAGWVEPSRENVKGKGQGQKRPRAGQRG